MVQAEESTTLPLLERDNLAPLLRRSAWPALPEDQLAYRHDQSTNLLDLEGFCHKIRGIEQVPWIGHHFIIRDLYCAHKT